jgi:3-oxosteroid 1-dehydrogenase
MFLVSSDKRMPSCGGGGMQCDDRQGRRVTTGIGTDVLVIGSGAGGLTAALVAAACGSRVLVCEKASHWGGTSATSGGFIWIPASSLGAAAGADDSVGDGFTYLRQVVDADIPDAKVRAFVENGREMLDWLHAHSEVRYRSIPYTDYRPDAPGAKLGYRTHDVLPMDGRQLGPSLAQLRPSAPAALLFNRIAFTMDDVFPLLHRPPGWWRTLLKVLIRYYGDLGQRVRSPRNRFLAAGNALLGRLRVSLDRHGVPVWLDAPVQELLRDPITGRVTGAIVRRGNETQRIEARRGVILASGGFEASAAMRRSNLPGAWPVECTGAVESNTGDGIEAGRAIGAATANMDSAWWGPMLKLPDESRARLLTFERALPGSIIVNQAGRRYMNEAMAYDLCGRAMIDADRPGASTSPSWFLFDSSYRRRYPMGPLLPRVPVALHQHGLKEILVVADSWARLAERTGLPADALAATVRDFNEQARLGVDPAFGRGATAYDRFYGDPKVAPNPNLAPLTQPPFFAVPIIAGDIGTNGGLLTNEHAQVLSREGAPIPGLYATGNTTASVMGHSYPGAGGTLGPAMTFGFIAARHACADGGTR